jgi:hypothetical protein
MEERKLKKKEMPKACKKQGIEESIKTDVDSKNERKVGRKTTAALSAAH